MIFHDRVQVIEQVQDGWDELGNPIWIETEVPYPAEVRPLYSSETVDAASQVQSRYRVHMPARAEEAVSSEGAVTWRGKRYEVEGDVEPHMIGRRTHHIEFIAHRTTG